jgi:toxin ParE1/3/4
VKRLELTEIARTDLKSIQRYSQRIWGAQRTEQYMGALRDTMKALTTGTIVSRERNDVRPGLSIVASGRHCIFFEGDESRILVVRVLHDRMDHRRHFEPQPGKPNND